jgi:hypothetical protein
VDSGFRHYLMRMLAKSPEDRPDAEEVAAWCQDVYLTTPDTHLDVPHPHEPAQLAVTEALAGLA